MAGPASSVVGNQAPAARQVAARVTLTESNTRPPLRPGDLARADGRTQHSLSKDGRGTAGDADHGSDHGRRRGSRGARSTLHRRASRHTTRRCARRGSHRLQLAETSHASWATTTASPRRHRTVEDTRRSPSNSSVNASPTSPTSPQCPWDSPDGVRLTPHPHPHSARDERPLPRPSRSRSKRTTPKQRGRSTKLKKSSRSRRRT